jgi:hypothetical protein
MTQQGNIKQIDEEILTYFSRMINPDYVNLGKKSIVLRSTIVGRRLYKLGHVCVA